MHQRTHQVPVGRVEGWAAATIVIASIVWHYLHGRDAWFTADFWGLLLGRELDAVGVLTAHGGHLAVVHVLITQIGYRFAGGMQAAPFFFLVRSVAWALLAGWVWFLVRRKGADPWPAGSMLALLAFYGLAAWLMGWFLGNPLAIGCGITAAYVIDTRPTPAWRSVIGVGSLLALGAAATSLGVAALAGVALGLVVARHRGRYWLSWSAATALYLSWFLLVRDDSGPGVAFTIGSIVRLPLTYLEIAAFGFGTIFPGGVLVGWAAALGATGWLAYRFFTRRLDVFQVILVCWSAVFVALVAITRIAAGQAATNTARYAYLVVLLLVVSVVSDLPWSWRGWSRLPLVVAVGATVWVNLGVLDRGIEFWVERSHASREVIESAAALITSGEPFIGEALIDEPRAGKLDGAGLDRLVDEGWSPQLAPDAEVVEIARGHLRIDVEPTARPEGCEPVDGPIRGMTNSFILVTGPGGSATIEFSDEWGIAVASVGERRARVVEIHPSPAGMVTVIPEGEVGVCT